METAPLAAIALAIVAFAAISGRAEQSPLTPPIFFVAVGFGLHALGLVEGAVPGAVLHGLAELTLVLVLFTDASRIELSCLRREGSLPARLLAVGMPLTIVLGAGAALWLLPGLVPAEALLLAAVLAPTDAALGQAVVTSPLVPVRIRQSLNVESGLNDGIALPAILLLASFIGAAEGAGDASYWARFAFLQLSLGPLVGAGVGYAGGKLLAVAGPRGWSNPTFEKLALLAFAVLAFAAAELVGGNGFIAAFVAGLAIGNTARGLCQSLHEFGEAEGQLLTLFVFVIFGAFLLPEAIAHAEPAFLGYAIVSLTLVRMLPVALSLWGAGLRGPSVAFLGWFGPRGLASILFALLVVEQGRLASSATFEAVVMLTVALSTLLHGITAYPLAKRYGRFAAGLAQDRHPEHEPETELPTRARAWQRRPPAGGES